MTAVQIVGNQLAAPQFGAYLFVVAAALPFGVDAAMFVAAAVLVATVRPTAVAAAARQDRADGRRSLRADIAEGMRWPWCHQALRMLAVCLCLMNVTFTGAFSVFVLYARARLGMSEIGYGVLLTASAVGGVLVRPRPAGSSRGWGAATLLRAGPVVESATHLSLALTCTPWVAEATTRVFGIHAAVWGVVSLSLRQRVVPGRLSGKVNGVYYLFSIGGSALGAGVRRRGGTRPRHHLGVLDRVRCDDAADRGGLAAVHTRGLREPAPAAPQHTSVLPAGASA